jgi:hypothetical protein
MWKKICEMLLTFGALKNLLSQLLKVVLSLTYDVVSHTEGRTNAEGI